MAKTVQPQCSMCQHHEICKYTEEYQNMFEEIKKQNHPLFEHQLTCIKFSDVRPVTLTRDMSLQNNLQSNYANV